MRNFFLASLAVLFVLAGGQASAQEWPTHTLTMINPFAAGGPNDVPARLFAQRRGEILGHYLCDIVTTAKPQIDGGTVKAIAVLNDTRSSALPDVPTAIEQGLDVRAYTWNAFLLPKRTPEAIVQ